jgi:GH24 family phage-related lysozyme (muramidase)
MAGSSRVDMRDLRTAVANGELQAMSNAILHMNVTMGNIWRREGIYDGMVARRRAEAKLVLTPDS